MKTRLLVFVAAAASMVGVLTLSNVMQPDAVQAAAPSPTKGKPEAVEGDMHEFMEYVFQPTYRRLKQSMAAEPADDGVWSSIKSDALILAEGGNLLLFRGAGGDSETWAEHGAAVRELGGKLYRAGKTKDYAAASRRYKALLKKCNSCHNEFAGGEHQLSP